jgi:hypothetical protein
LPLARRQPVPGWCSLLGSRVPFIPALSRLKEIIWLDSRHHRQGRLIFNGEGEKREKKEKKEREKKEKEKERKIIRGHHHL